MVKNIKFLDCHSLYSLAPGFPFIIGTLRYDDLLSISLNKSKFMNNYIYNNF